MKEKTVSNPYRDQSRGDLYDSAQRRAEELMKPKGTRSKEERAALALDTAHLLLSMAGFVSSGEFTAGSPQHTLKAGRVGLRDVFVAEYARMMREVRYIVFTQAADAALGAGVLGWATTNAVGVKLYEAAMQSEDGLLAALERLQTLYEAERPNNRGAL